MGFRCAVARLFVILAVMLGWGGVAAAQGLSGKYIGIDDAVGASIDIRPNSKGFKGTFFDARGKSQAFNADRDGDNAEAILDKAAAPCASARCAHPYQESLQRYLRRDRH